MTITEEQISAFIDGEMDGAERARLAAAIEADTALKRRVEALRRADGVFARAFDAIDAAPMPPGVLSLLEEKPYAENVVPLRRKPAPSWAMPLAAALALGAGVGIGVLVAGGDDGATLAGRVTERALVAALETRASGETAPLSGGRVATLVLSFESPDGAWCREFTIAGENDGARALACREAGEWAVKLAAAEAPADGGYQPAASGVAAGFDAAAAAMGAEAPLDAAAEAALIAKGWAR